ncbi:MAG: hypothetical protein WA840_01020 [Caulobacteraceae bacterium]
MSTADVVNEWFRQRLANGPLARDTPAYNQVAQALPALISSLEGVGVETKVPAAEVKSPAAADAAQAATPPA